MSARLCESPHLTSPRGRGIGLETSPQRERNRLGNLSQRDGVWEPLPEGEGLIWKSLPKGEELNNMSISIYSA